MKEEKSKNKPKSEVCRRCGRHGGLIKKYGLYYCRHCFREIAEDIEFKKY